MTKIEETENVFFALGTALKADGFKQMAFNGFGKGSSRFNWFAK